MAELLLELYSEEIPPQLQIGARTQLKEFIESSFKEHEIKYKDLLVYSSLGLMDFMRRYTVQTLSAKGIQDLGPDIMRIADAEGLDAHRNAVAIRLAKLGGKA